MFGDLEGVGLFIDDMIITGKTEVEHDVKLIAAFGVQN